MQNDRPITVTNDTHSVHDSRVKLKQQTGSKHRSKQHATIQFATSPASYAVHNAFHKPGIVTSRFQVTS